MQLLYEFFNDLLLTESKQDEQNFKDAFGDELLNQFKEKRDKKQLQAPYNDYYYWMQKKDNKWVQKKSEKELISFLSNVQNKQIEAKGKKGAKLIYKNDRLQVYFVTTPEASFALGQGTGWCTSGRYQKAEDEPSDWDACKNHWNREVVSNGFSGQFIFILDIGDESDYDDEEIFNDYLSLRKVNIMYSEDDNIYRPSGGAWDFYDQPITTEFFYNQVLDYYCDNVEELEDRIKKIIKSKDWSKEIFYWDGKSRAPQDVVNVVVKDGVTAIGEYEFSGCSSLTSISIPSSVTSIDKAAFQYCSSLTSIEIPSSVEKIGDCAFYSCRSLTSIEIPNSVEHIDEAAFQYCSSLTSIEIPSSVTSVGNYAFSSCSRLTSIDIPSSVEKIGDYAFYGCRSLTSIEIPSSVESIGHAAFYLCIGLTTIEIPSSVEKIGDYAFNECSRLTSIEIPNSVESIGRAAFYGCSSLTSIEIPSSVTDIGRNAFIGCSRLTSIEIPNSVTSIGSSAFYGCLNLPTITIPSSVKSIGSNAFFDCNKLHTIICKNPDLIPQLQEQYPNIEIKEG